MDVSLDSALLDELNGPEARVLHELLEQLRAYGIGDLIALPQIVVVGKQSAGKSSVLEAITHIPFPVNYNACTRFATEFVLRRAETTTVHASIRRADRTVKSVLPHTGFSQDSLPDIIKSAEEQMSSVHRGGFSKDVLRIEIAAPNMYPLSLVDLPGLFTTVTQDQSEDDIDTVSEITERYAREAHSIILVVVGTTDQLANQDALQIFKRIDRVRERTLGVITKPDLAPAGESAEREYIRLATNAEPTHRLKLGWHVLRNRAESESRMDQRDENERQFFSTSAWGRINATDLGIVRLREKLSRAQYTYMRRNMPTVVDDIRNILKTKEEQLTRLGDAISQPDDMRRFLRGLARTYWRLAHEGVQGRYSDPFFGELDNPQNKLRSQIRNYNRVFNFILQTRGAKKRITDSEVAEPFGPNRPEFLDGIINLYNDHSELSELVTAARFTSRVREMACSNQGAEFPGSANHALVLQLFKMQASPWGDIAKFHLQTILSLSKQFVTSLIYHIVGASDDHRSRVDAILDHYAEPFFAERQVELQNKLQELLKPYTNGFAMPLEDEFQRARHAKSRTRLAEAFSERDVDQQSDTNTSVGRDRNDRTTIQDGVNNPVGHRTGLEDPQNAVLGIQETVDMMEVYYEMSLRTFTDNVINLASESCLIQNIPQVLEALEVNNLTEEDLHRFAAESQTTRDERTRLQEDIKSLKQGLAACERMWRHESSTLPTASIRNPTDIHEDRVDTDTDGENDEDNNEADNGGENPSTPIANPVHSTGSVRPDTTSTAARETSAATTGGFSFTSLFNALPDASATGRAAPSTTSVPRTTGLFGSSVPPTTTAESSRSVFENVTPSTTSTTTAGFSGGGLFRIAPHSTTSSSSGSIAFTPSTTTAGSGSGNASRIVAPSTTTSPSGTSIFGTPATTTAGSEGGGLSRLPPSYSTSASSGTSIFGTPASTMAGSGGGGLFRNTAPSTTSTSSGFSLFGTPSTTTAGSNDRQVSSPSASSSARSAA